MSKYPRWYYYLNRKEHRNLLDSEKIEQDSIVVSNWTGEKKYAVFSGHVSFYEFQEKEQYHKKCFFEILFPGSTRKPYFDIDMEKEKYPDFCEKSFFFEVYRSLFCIFPDLRHKGSVLVFSSHTDKKRSYHIVIDGWYLQNYEECQIFYQRFLLNIEDKYHSVFDESVYKSTQQFRMLWSHKYQKDNTKNFYSKFSYNVNVPKRYQTIKGKNLFIFFSSLVSKTEKCYPIIGFEKKVSKKKQLEEGKCSEKDHDEAMSMFRKDSQFREGSFEKNDMVEEKGNLIIPLKSNRPYHCETCQRTHQAENPYLIVRGEEREIFFDCRRSKDVFGKPKRKFIGKLGIPPQQENMTDVLDIKENIILKKSPKRSPPRLEKLMLLKRENKKKAQPKHRITLKLYS